MSSFSALLSTLDKQPQTQQSSSNPKSQPQAGQQGKNPNESGNGTRLVANNTAAGVKRKSEEPESVSGPKTAKVEQNGVSARPPGSAPSKRFQLSARGESQPKVPSIPQGPSTKQMERLNLQKTSAKPVAQRSSSSPPKPTPTATRPVPAKRGFAAIMERGKSAMEAAKVTAPSGITHKPAEKMTKKERLRMMEEAKAQQKSGKSGKVRPASRDHSSSPAPGKPNPQKKGQETGYKGTMKKPAEPLAYKGTMRAVNAGRAREKEKKKGIAQDRYGGYASWSDLSGAEDEEEDYDSEGSSDMEGGFDDVQKEEDRALKDARREDLEELQADLARSREKAARKHKLEQLSNSAAAKKKKY